MPQKAKDNHIVGVGADTITTAVANSPEAETQLGQTQISAAVLMYHHVGPVPNGADEIRKGLTVSQEEFETHLKFFKEHGYTVISWKKFDELKEKRAVPKKLIILTFDDGYDDNYTYAADLMKKYNATGTFFIITGKIGKNEYMNEEQLKSLVSSGNELGSHTVNHPSLEKLKGESLKSELVKSKTTLEKIAGEPIISFCYPAGKYGEDTVKAVKDAGYEYAVTTKSSTGIIDLDGSLEIPRYRISAGRNIEAMLK